MTRTQLKSDVWPTGGCAPFDSSYNYGGPDQYWVFGKTVTYIGSNTSQVNNSDWRYTPGVIPTLVSGSVTSSYNTFKIKTILYKYFFQYWIITAPLKQSYTNAGLAMLRDFKYEKSTIWYDPNTGLINTDKIKYGPDIEDYLINIMEYPDATKHVLLSILERDVIKSTKSMADILYPIERIDIVCNNMGTKTEYLLTNTNSTVQCSNILRSFIVNSRDISSDKLSVIYTPQSELIRSDIELSGALRTINISVYAYTKQNQYFKLNAFDRRSSLKLCFTKKSI